MITKEDIFDAWDSPNELAIRDIAEQLLAERAAYREVAIKLRSLCEKFHRKDQDVPMDIDIDAEADALRESVEAFGNQIRERTLEECAEIADRKTHEYGMQMKASDNAFVIGGIESAETIRNLILTLKGKGKTK